jgi:hypothetical protein
MSTISASAILVAALAILVRQFKGHFRIRATIDAGGEYIPPRSIRQLSLPSPDSSEHPTRDE